MYGHPRLIAALLTSGGMAVASAQSLNGLDVHAWFNITGDALFGVVDETKTVGPGVEFQWNGFSPPAGATPVTSADFEGSTLTLTRYMGQSTTNDELTSWWFHLPGDRDFTSFTLLSSNFPVPLLHQVQDSGLASGIGMFAIPVWRESDATPPGSVFTARYEVTFSGAAPPIPEPSTYGLMLAGLVGIAGLAVSRRRRT